ncbi:MAG: MBL fold metallo-hydrolase [Pseudomonadota bacterium]
MNTLRRIILRFVLGATALLLTVSALLYWLWQDRHTLEALAIPTMTSRTPSVDAVTATWFGTSMLVIDDGDTQILIDAYVSRPSVLSLVLDRPIASDAAAINRFILDNRLERLSAIIPGHTHFDHSLDIAAIANRSRASIIGSRSAASIAKGAGVPDDQVIVVEESTEFQFGEFVVTLLPTEHGRFGWNASIPFAGEIEAPLATPARASAYRAGRCFSILIAHPQGTALVQTSAGFVPDALNGVAADVVFLGVGMLETMGRDYAEQYWLNLVTMSGAERVIPLHFDDYTQPFGTTRLPPDIIDSFAESARWLDEFRSIWDRNTRLEIPVFGEPFALYGDEASTDT